MDKAKEKVENISAEAGKDRCGLLEINVHDNKKLVDIWLTRTEQAQPALRTYVNSLCHDFTGKGYTAAVFLSGEKDLAEETSALLCYNKKRIPELEVQREREQQMNMTM